MLIVISTRPPLSVAYLTLSFALSFLLTHLRCLACCVNVYHLDGSLEIVIMPQNVARLLVDFALQLFLLRLAMVPLQVVVLCFVLPWVFVIYVTISVNRA